MSTRKDPTPLIVGTADLGVRGTGTDPIAEARNRVAALDWAKARREEYDALMAQEARLREEMGLTDDPAARPDANDGPVATPEEAIAAFAKHGSDRKAAAALGISRTQLRRLRGLEH